MSKLLIICAERYNGHELWTLLGVLQSRKHQFEVVSQNTLIRDELTLKPNTIARTVWQVDYNDPQLYEQFDAVVVVSGNMADTEKYWTDTHVIALLKAFREKQKLCAAICCSVPTLAPIVKDVEVSFFPLMRSRHRLRDHGAVLKTTSLTVDRQHGGTVTAENQMITQMWAEEICNVLEDLPLQHVLHDSGFVPKGSERRMTGPIRDAIDEARGYKMVIKKDKLTGKKLTNDDTTT